jgi:hypothetical protein
MDRASIPAPAVDAVQYDQHLTDEGGADDLGSDVHLGLGADEKVLPLDLPLVQRSSLPYLSFDSRLFLYLRVLYL